MRLHKEDFEILKVIGRGAFGEVSNFTLSLSAIYTTEPPIRMTGVKEAMRSQ